MEGFISQFAQGGRLIFPDSAYTISCGVQLINFVTDIIILRAYPEKKGRL
jgi:hypothetical protein